MKKEKLKKEEFKQENIKEENERIENVKIENVRMENIKKEKIKKEKTKKEKAIDYTIKVVFVTLFLIGIQWLSGKFVLTEIFTGPHYLMWRRVHVLAAVIVICGFLFEQYLTNFLGLHGGNSLGIVCPAMLFTSIFCLVKSITSPLPFIRFEYGTEVDYLVVLIVSIFCLIFTVPFCVLVDVTKRSARIVFNQIAG